MSVMNMSEYSFIITINKQNHLVYVGVLCIFNIEKAKKKKDVRAKMFARKRLSLLFCPKYFRFFKRIYLE